MTAKTEFGNEVFTIIRDAKLEEQFYFVPSRPHIAIETRNGKKSPVFQLLSYQRKQKDSDTLIQGGILQMSVQTGISKETEADLLRLIKSQFPLSDATKKHRLSPIPMKDAVIAMYDLDGKLMDSAPIKEGIAPIFGNQQFPFMLNLTDLGVDAMDALVSGKGGLPVLITYTFQGMTPPGGFKIEVNWDACYKHLSADTKLRAEVGYGNLGANLGADMSKIREEMTSNGMIKVTALSNEALSDAALDAAMTPVLTLITTELFEQIKTPEQITPAQAKEIAPPQGLKEPEAGKVASATSVSAANGIAASPAASDAAGAAAGAAGDAAGQAAGAAMDAAATSIPYVGTIMKVLDVAADMAKNTKVGIGASFALKDAKYVKKGSFVYTYDRQAIVDRKTSFGGPIGIGSFDKKTQEDCKIVLPDGRWESAFYNLPDVGNPSSLGISQITMSVVPVFNGQPITGQKIESAYFKTSNGFWTDKSNKTKDFFLFPLKAIYDSPAFQSERNKFQFKITTEVTPVQGSFFKVESTADIFDGELAMTPPSTLLQTLYLSADCISLGDGVDEVKTIKGNLKVDGLNFPIKLDANKTAQGFIFPKDAKSVQIQDLQFMNKQGKKLPWKYNNKELLEVFPGLDIELVDSDWKKELDADDVAGGPTVTEL
ncbi:MAG: hypothetical protein ACOYXC_01040 [Candidatus Rifleibacteriota bacterium]